MIWNKWVRQIHRWLSVAFTVSVIVTFIALSQEKPVIWVSYVPLLPLALLTVDRPVLVPAAVCHQVAQREPRRSIGRKSLRSA